jgi:hypothetical protein
MNRKKLLEEIADMKLDIKNSDLNKLDEEEFRELCEEIINMEFEGMEEE